MPKKNSYLRMVRLKNIFKELREEMAHNVFVDMIKAQAVPNEVFKYRKWKLIDVENPNHDDDVIEKLELHFANPDKFTDKMDCRNRINYLQLFYSHILWCKFYYKLVIENLEKNNEEVIFSNFYNKIVNELIPGKKNIDEYAKFIADEWISYCEKVGVLSLAEIPNGMKLWDEYGDGFKGVCYGFDANKLGFSFNIQSPEDFIAKSVVYENKLEQISPFANLNVKMYKRTFQKLKDRYVWEHESRIKIMESDIERNKKFSIDCLTRIIFGFNMSKENFDNFISVLHMKNGDHIPLFVAKLDGCKVIVESLEDRLYWG